MISLKVSSTAAAMVLLLPIAAHTPVFAQGGHRVGAARGGVHAGAFHGAPGRGGGVRYGGGYRGGYGVGAGLAAGAAAGAVVGGAIASQGYYGGPGYYAPGYYDNSYAYGDNGYAYSDNGYAYGDNGYNDNTFAAVPAPSGDNAVAYCTQRFRSYDPASGTYLGNDGQRHPCP
jgi:BA14K-like protein